MNTDGRSTDGAGAPRDDGQVDVRDLFGAYALDAVDDVERRAVERLVSADPEAAHELAGLTATAALLGGAVAAKPPVELRAAVLAQIGRTSQVGTRDPARAVGAPTSDRTDPAARRAGPSRRALWLAVAATALGAAAIPSAVAWQQAQHAHLAEQQAQGIAQVLADPAARVVHANVTGGGLAVGVLAGQRAVFTATGLADPGAGKAYQLWVLGDGKPLSVGVLAANAGSVRAITDRFAAGDSLAVTIEPAGGSAEPTTTPIVVLAAA
ncbi:MAG: anti-sigma factor domain-containing protein [Cellulomonas sp.]